jgi:MFS family permease
MSVSLSIPRATRGFSWLVAGLLLLCLLLNYIDRQILSVLAPFLPQRLRMDDVTYGRIQALFLLAYGLAMPFAGWAIDRLRAKWGLALSVAAWSLIEALHGTARNLLALGSNRLLCIARVPELLAVLREFQCLVVFRERRSGLAPLQEHITTRLERIGPVGAHAGPVERA